MQDKCVFPALLAVCLLLMGLPAHKPWWVSPSLARRRQHDRRIPVRELDIVTSA